MKALFKTVQDRLTAQVSALQFIDFDMGQIDLPEDERPAINFPCALIDINFPTTEDIADDTQLVNAVVSIRIADQVQGTTDSITAALQRDAALGYLDLVDSVYKALQAYETSEFSNFSRVSQQGAIRADGIREVTINLNTTFEDLSATS